MLMRYLVNLKNKLKKFRLSELIPKNITKFMEFIKRIKKEKKKKITVRLTWRKKTKKKYGKNKSKRNKFKNKKLKDC